MSAPDAARSPRARRQWRVQRELDRIAELERLYREAHITVDQARELFRLRENEAKRRAGRAWRSRNRDHCTSATKAWRAANPGC